MPATAPAVGTVENGYRFKGGNPADESNWEQAGPVDVSDEWGQGAVRLPNGKVVRYGSRGGMTVLNGADAAPDGPTAGVKPAGADARTRLTLGLGPMVEAERTMRRMEEGGYSFNDDWGARALEAVPLDGGAAARIAGGADYQQYDQAARTFEAAVMPIMSGAAVTPSEAQRQIRANLPQWGDTPEVLAAKAKNRAMMINAAAAMVGQEMPYPEIGIWGNEQPEQPQQAPAPAPAQAPPAQPLQSAGAGATVSDRPSGVYEETEPRPPGVPLDAVLTYREDGSSYWAFPSRASPSARTPEAMRAAGFEYDPERGTWFRMVTPGANRVDDNGPDDGPPMPGGDGPGGPGGLDPEALAAAREAYGDVVPGQLAAFNQGATFGFADEIAAALDGVGTRVGNFFTPGEDPYSGAEAEAASRYVQRERMADFAERRPVQNFALQTAGGIVAPGTRTAGAFVAGGKAVAPGANAVQRLMTSPKLLPQMVRGSATGAGMGAAYGAGMSEGGLEERAQGAVEGAVTGAAVGGALPPAARLAGAVVKPVVSMVEGGARSVGNSTANTFRAMTGQPTKPNTFPDARRASMLAERGGVTPQQMGAKAEEIRNFGGEPVVADLIGDGGQGQVRAAATRNTPGRDRAVEFAGARRVDAQDFTAGLGSRVSPRNYSPQQLEDGLARAQSALSAPEFGAVRASRFQPGEGTRQALATPGGQQAVAQARQQLANSLDPQEQALAAELDNLLQGDGTMSVGAADYVSRFLLGDASRLANREQGGNAARLIGQLGTVIRDDARQAVPGYDQALRNYASRASLGDAAEVGQRFVGNKGNTNDFVAGVSGMTPEENAFARAAARSGIEEGANTPARAAGTLDALANGRGQQQRSQALLGEGGYEPQARRGPAQPSPSPAANDTMQLQGGPARMSGPGAPQGGQRLLAGPAGSTPAPAPRQGPRYIGASELRRGAQVGKDLLQTGRNVNPRQGSESILNSVDQNGLDAAGAVGGNALMGRWGQAARSGMDWLRSRGMSDQEAEQIVKLALDPARTDEVIRLLTQRLGPEGGKAAAAQLRVLNPALAGEAGGAQARPERPRVSMVNR